MILYASISYLRVQFRLLRLLVGKIQLNIIVRDVDVDGAHVEADDVAVAVDLGVVPRVDQVASQVGAVEEHEEHHPQAPESSQDFAWNQ